MEIGACLELSTIRYPNQFLLLACSANLLKNLAAVAASSTRAPIYRSFALQNNLADVTAKGESVANLSDILGVSFGIGISRFNWPIGINFLLLSTGYLIASRKEVDSVILPYMNQVCFQLQSSYSPAAQHRLQPVMKHTPLATSLPAQTGLGCTCSHSRCGLFVHKQLCSILHLTVLQNQSPTACIHQYGIYFQSSSCSCFLSREVRYVTILYCVCAG